MSKIYKSLELARSTPRSVCVSLVIVLAFVMFSSLPEGILGQRAHAFARPSSLRPDDTPSPTPTATPDEVLDQAKREALIATELKTKAVADKDRAEAEAARLKAETQPLGPASVNIPTGNVQTDAAGWVESQMLAQEAARQITIDLAGKLCTGKFLPGGVAEPVLGEAAPTQAINTLVIYNNNDLGGVELYVTVLGQLSQLKQEFSTENPKTQTNLDSTDPRVAPVAGLVPAAIPILAAPAVATSAIKSVAEIINLFRTDTSFQNKSVQISEDMVVSHIVNYFGNVAAPPAAGAPASRCNQSIKVYYPALFPPKLVKSPQTSAVLILLNQVEGLKNEAALLLEKTDARIKDITNLRALLADRKKSSDSQAAKEADLGTKSEELKKCKTPAECKRIQAEIKDLEKDIAELKKAIVAIDQELAPDGTAIKANAASFKGWLSRLTEQKSKMTARITATELLSAKLNTPDSDTKLTALAQLLRAEKLSDILSNSQTFTLRVAVTANGTTKIKKNIFVDAKVRHSAGANVVYQLFNRDGVLAQGNVMQCYIGYRSSRDVQDVTSGIKTVECKSN